MVHKECLPSRTRYDNNHENALYDLFDKTNVFSMEPQSRLQNIVTKDLATEGIQTSLLTSFQEGQAQVNDFVEERLISQDEQGLVGTKFREPIHMNNSPTFASLYEVKRQDRSTAKQSILKVDHSILHRLLVASQSGRKVSMETLLQHELMPVPVSLCEMDKSLRTGAKSVLTDALTQNVKCPQSVTLQGESGLVIDGQALVMAIGKPDKATTFGGLADTFVKCVFQKGSSYSRIDVVFDRYRNTSIKSSTRTRRSKGAHGIRRVIEDRNVPLPHNWQSFLAVKENKADLANFLSNELIDQSQNQAKTVIVAGGFVDEMETKCSNDSLSVNDLKANHEEGDTRLVLHAIHMSNVMNMSNIVLTARDVDVLIILLAHLEEIASTCKVWMMAGTAKKPKYIPVWEVFQKLPKGSEKCILQFHALTGTDTTSFIYGHSKKTAWEVFKQHFGLLVGIGNNELTSTSIQQAEEFLCKIYNAPTGSLDEARALLFPRTDLPDKLPPTSDAFSFHIRRVHFQAMVWQQANAAVQQLPKPEEMGWEMNENVLVPKLMSLEPIPQACLDMIHCKCRTGCRDLRCKCRRAKLPCTGLCTCADVEQLLTCINRAST